MLKVIIAEDHGLVRAGIRALLERNPEVEVIAEALDGQHAIELVTKMKPDVLLMDLSMPRMNGMEALERLKALGSPTRTLVVSMHTDTSIIIRALRAGAKGYLLKHSFPEELGLAVSAAARGELYISPRAAEEVINSLLEDSSKTGMNPIDELTPREREVFQLVIEGKTNRQVASMLTISIKTVDKHRTSLMKKLKVHDLAELMNFAVNHQFLFVGGVE